MFLGPDDEDGARGMAHDLFGDTAEEDMLEAGVAVGGNDDEIGVVAGGVIRDPLPGTTAGDNRFGFNSRAQVAREVLELPGELPDPGILGIRRKQRNNSEIGRVAQGLHHVQQDEPGTELLGEDLRIMDGFLRWLGEVDGDKDALQFEVASISRTVG